MKRLGYISFLLIVLIIGVLTAIQPSFNSGVFFVFFSLICGGSIHYFLAGKSSYTVKVWIVISFVPFTYVVKDALCLLGISCFDIKNASTVIELLPHLIPELTMLIVVVVYMINGFKKIHWTKFFVDLGTILLIILGLCSGLIFSKMSFADFSNLISLYVVINIIFDILIVTSLLLLLSSVKLKKLDRSILVLALSFTVYIYADFSLLYDLIVPDYHLPEINVYFYYLSFIIMVFGASMIEHDVKQNKSTLEQNPENLMNTRVILVLVIIPILLFAMGHLSLGHLTIISITIIIYQYVNVYIQKMFTAESIINEKEKVMKLLEEKVDDRTRALKIINDELYFKSITDSLTGLNNKSYLIENANEIILSETPLALIYIKIDRLWVVSSYHGHQIEDQIIKIIASRLRELEKSGFIVSYLGGQEYGVLVPHYRDHPYEEVSQKLHEIIDTPVKFDELEFNLHSSVGISRYPYDSDNTEDLVKNAVLAMNFVQSNTQKEEIMFFTDDMRERVSKLNKMEMCLRKANYDTDFELLYQPKFDMEKQDVIGMEALLRWNHFEEGTIMPTEFIPVAEETGLIIKISDWVFKTAFAQVSNWNREYGLDLKVSVNLSPLSFESPNFLETIKYLIAQTETKPEWVEFEITERVAITNDQNTLDILRELRTLGFTISIDDFGTGYSSFAYMQNYEVDMIKIARELIENVTSQDQKYYILEAILTMTNGMNLHAIAEGVETKEQLKILEKLDCHLVQGYIIDYPLSVEAFEMKYLIDNDNR